MLTHALEILASAIGIASLLIVSYGALIAALLFIKNELKRFSGDYHMSNIGRARIIFGTYLLLGLEFLIASDILKSILEPTMDELITLGGVVVIRTVLSIFLNRELKELESTQPDDKAIK